HRPYLARVIAAEQEDLKRGDVPIFTTRPGSRHVWSSAGGCINNFLDDSGMATVRRRLEQFGSEDLARQTWFIRASLSTHSINVGSDAWAKYQIVEPRTILDDDQLRGRLLEEAARIGDRLGALAMRYEKEVNWVGLKLEGDRNWRLAPLAWDLYQGLPG